MFAVILHTNGFHQAAAWAQPTKSATLESTAALTAQTSVDRLIPSEWPLPNSLPNSLSDSLLPTQSSNSIAPIYLDGRELFYLSAPAVDGEQAAELRAQTIQQRINQLATQQIREASALTIEIDEPTRLPVILADDQQLLTVTSLDAQVNGYTTPNGYAIILQRKIETAFNRYITERQSEYLKRQTQNSAAIIGTVLLLLLGSKYIQQRLQKRQKGLVHANTRLGETTLSARPPMVATALAETVDSVIDLIRAQLDNRQKRKLNEMAIGLLFILQVGLCIGGGLWILSLFPYSRWAKTLLLQWTSIPARILLIAGIAYGVLRVVSLLIDKICLTLQESTRWAPDAPQRLRQRFFTLSQVIKGVTGAVIFSVMVLTMLTIAGVQVGPLLAGAGIIGVGISLAAQSLIKDIINGFFILFEDQFGIGDVIIIGNVSGSVEVVNLRVTQLRDTQGRLITIPNSQIDIVQNLSKDWSQVDLSITVGPNNDIEKALNLFKSTAADLAKAPDWQTLILEPPELLGIDNIDSTGITLRLLLKTQPLKQWPVARELRQRLKQAFDKADISTGIPQERLEISWKEGAEKITALAADITDEETTA
ncbi:MAG: mechanosensitive ion channel family protein [Cyanobacteria bacterium P01_C01_bin.69]